MKTLRIGYAQDPATTMGPLIEPAHGPLRTALTELGDGESWLVTPRPLDESDRLWTPGVKDGVAPGSPFHLTEYFGPVLGIMRAATLDEAVRLQNATGYGLTAGIHSLDAAEVARWLNTVEAGNLFVNRAITGAIVQRQPFGGWKRSSVGTGAKAGGPNYLLGLGDWAPVFGEPSTSVKLRGLSERVTRLIEAAQPSIDFVGFDRVRTAALSDEKAWQTEFGLARDASGLVVERNILRYRPVPVTIRLAEGASMSQLVRVLAAATRAGAPVSISSAVPLGAGLIRLFGGAQSPLVVTDVVVESDARWLARAGSGEARLSRRASRWLHPSRLARRSRRCSAATPTSRSTPRRSRHPAASNCCPSCGSSRSASPPTASATPIPRWTPWSSEPRGGRVILPGSQAVGATRSGVVDGGDIRMRAQPALERVLPIGAEDRVRRVGRDAARLGLELRREFERGDRGVQSGVEEERDRDAVRPDDRRDHAVHRGLEIAVGCHLEQFADVDDEGAGNGRGVDPVAVLLHLQAALARLDEEQGEHAGILVGADALLGGRVGLAGVAHDLDEGGRVFREGRVEHVLVGAEGDRPGPQELQPEGGELGVPAGDDLAQIGKGGRPLVRSLEPPVVRDAGPLRDGGPLRADVDLLAPVDLAQGEFAADPGVAAEVGLLRFSIAILSASGRSKNSRAVRMRSSCSSVETPWPTR